MPSVWFSLGDSRSHPFSLAERVARKANFTSLRHLSACLAATRGQSSSRWGAMPRSCGGERGRDASRRFAYRPSPTPRSFASASTISSDSRSAALSELTKYPHVGRTVGDHMCVYTGQNQLLGAARTRRKEREPHKVRPLKLRSATYAQLWVLARHRAKGGATRTRNAAHGAVGTDRCVREAGEAGQNQQAKGVKWILASISLSF
jgi:hypothetical protein